jgi:hypothetical protein
MDITIHRALSQLKTTKARITQKLHEDIYIFADGRGQFW